MFAKYYIIRDLTPVETGGVVAASFLAAVLSWQFVEQPFRQSHGVTGRAGLFAAAGGLMAVFVAFGLASDRGGPIGVLTAFAHGDERANRYRNPDFDRCIGGLRTRLSRTPADVLARDLCPLGDPAAAPSFVLWGDCMPRPCAPGSMPRPEPTALRATSPA